MIHHDGFMVDPARGLVYGTRGRPIGSPDSDGYLQIDRRSTGGGMVSVSRFIWAAVHGPIPPGLEVNHRNGIKADNGIANLELVTHAGNIQHAYRAGLKSNAGEKHPSHKLTAEHVRSIRRSHAAGESKGALSARFAVHRRTINDVVLGHSWKDVA